MNPKLNAIATIPPTANTVVIAFNGASSANVTPLRH